ncbi:MAG: Crp/Fnr family transcriptional regulator [Bacteroidota bacterium]
MEGDSQKIEEFQAYINAISPLRAETFGNLLKLFRPTFLQKNEYFVHHGAYSKQIGFLTEGVVRAFFLNPEGKEYTKQFFVGPSIIGAYASLISGQPTQVAQQALTDCEIMVADFVKIRALYDHHQDLERLARKIAEYYFIEKEQKELEMALLDADKRYLLMREKFPTIENVVPQYYIASYLGISPTQLSRVRKKLSQ